MSVLSMFEEHRGSQWGLSDVRKGEKDVRGSQKVVVVMGTGWGIAATNRASLITVRTLASRLSEAGALGAKE